MVVIFALIAAIGIGIASFVPSTKIGVEKWCTLNKTTEEVQCNYQTKEDCETYREENEICVENPEPGKKY